MVHMGSVIEKRKKKLHRPGPCQRGGNYRSTLAREVSQKNKVNAFKPNICKSMVEHPGGFLIVTEIAFKRLKARSTAPQKVNPSVYSADAGAV